MAVAFDVVMDEPVPFKGLVLTQLSAWWFAQLASVTRHHLISADTDEIIAAIPAGSPIPNLRRRGYGEC